MIALGELLHESKVGNASERVRYWLTKKASEGQKADGGIAQTMQRHQLTAQEYMRMRDQMMASQNSIHWAPWRSVSVSGYASPPW